MTIIVIGNRICLFHIFLLVREDTEYLTSVLGQHV